MKNSHLIFIILLFPLIFSCATASREHYSSVNRPDALRIAVLPLKSEYQEVDLSRINEYFYSAVTRNLVSKSVINKETFEDSFVKIKEENPGLATSEAESRVLDSLDADSSITGLIKYYREREGSDLGVKSPASVIFIMHLADAETYVTYWSCEFDETQLPLFSDITRIKKFFNRKGKWITAEDLLKEGIDQCAAKLSDYIEANN